jgi:hypothetical protein
MVWNSVRHPAEKIDDLLVLRTRRMVNPFCGRLIWFEPPVATSGNAKDRDSRVGISIGVKLPIADELPLASFGKISSERE